MATMESGDRNPPGVNSTIRRRRAAGQSRVPNETETGELCRWFGHSRESGLGFQSSFRMETTPMSVDALKSLDLAPHRFSLNLSSGELIERAIAAGEGKLASNGALVCL